tara:strand:- start:15883 stop:16503 length:621 start_codon:yes stop_codon:yes gene_type:complete
MRGLILFCCLGLVAATLCGLRRLVVTLWLGFATWGALGLWLAFGCFHQTALCFRFDLDIGLWLLVRIARLVPVIVLLALIVLRALIVLLSWIATLIAITLLALSTLAVAFGLAFAVLAFLLLAALVNFALRLAEHPQVMFCVLLEILGRNAVVAQLCVTRQLVILFNNLLWRAAHLALRAGAVEHPIDDIAAALGRTLAIILRSGT